MKRVLITGATGFLGRNAIDPLVKKGYEVHCITSREVDAIPGIHWHRLDLLDGSALKPLLTKVRATHLLHFAWYADPGSFWHSAQNFAWLEASITLLRSFKEAGGERVVMAGTCAEYDWDYGYCSELVTPCRPVTPYGICKNVLRETLLSYCELERMSGAWGRIFFLYGPYEHSSRLLSSVITSLLQGGVAQCTHGNQVRDFMHVKDVAAAFVSLLDSPVEGTVNIASGQPVAIRDIVLTAAKLLNASDRVQFGAIQARPNEPPLLVGDCRRLSNEVFWVPHYNVNDGIAQTVDWWKAKLPNNLV